MTELWIWGLIASLILLAVGLALKSAQDFLSFNQKEKEVIYLTSEINALKKHHHETITSIEQSNAAEKTKLTNRISALEQQLKLLNAKPIQYPDLGIR